MMMWKITRDYNTSPEEKAQGKTWVGHCSHNWNEAKAKELGTYAFRLMDDDDRIDLHGVATDDESEAAFEPVDYFEGLIGCVHIQYRNRKTGEWETL